MKTYFERVQEQTSTRFWVNNATREQADLAIAHGAVGCTQNPAYTWKMISHEFEGEFVKAQLLDILEQESDDNEALVTLQRRLIAGVAQRFMPLFEASGGKKGYVSIQGDPFHEDTDTIVRHARANVAASPNLMAKVPVTEDGLRAIEILLGEGVPINATEVMAVRQALDVCGIYNRVAAGLEKPPLVYVSHITGIYDEYLGKTVKSQSISVCPDALWQAGMAIAKKAYHMMRAVCPTMGFIGGGARGLQHFTEMVGADAVVTINWVGTADKLIEQDPVVVQRFLAPVPESVIDELVEKIEDFRRGYFVNAIEPKEYEDFGPVVLFRQTFEDAWQNALDFLTTLRQQSRRANLSSTE